ESAIVGACGPSLSRTFRTTMALWSPPLAARSCSSITRSTIRLILPTITRLSSSYTKPFPRATPLPYLNCRVPSIPMVEVLSI
ncbi:Manganese/iron superoxide dismutase, partial [Parasponia andersonii]